VIHQRSSHVCRKIPLRDDLHRPFKQVVAILKGKKPELKTGVFWSKRRPMTLEDGTDKVTNVLAIVCVTLVENALTIGQCIRTKSHSS
jgi:hypothetical protein